MYFCFICCYVRKDFKLVRSDIKLKQNMNNNQLSNVQIDSNTNQNNNNSMKVEFTTKNQKGIQLNQRPTTSVSLKQGSNTRHDESDNVIQEKAWTLDDIMQRYKFVNSFPVLSSQMPHTILAKFKVPQDLIDSNSATQAPFDNFLFWNGDIHIHSQMTASPTVQGCVMAVFIPLTSETFIETALIPNFAALSVNQSNYLFPNTNTSADMIIKYNSPYSNLNIQNPGLDPDNSLGYLYYIVLNQTLLSTSSTDNIAISVFTHFETNKFKVPRMVGVTTRYKPKVRAQVLPVGTPKPASTGLVTSIINKVMPDNVIGDAIDAAVGIFGLDNPTISKIQEPSKPLTTQHMNFHTGAEYIDKLTINPSATTCITQDTFATTTDEMSYDYLYSKYSYLGSFSVKSEDSPGKVVASFPMNPCPVRVNSMTNQKVPLLQYLATLFEFWNGSINYRFQIVSTMMQTCKLMIGLNYGEFTPETSGLLEKVASQYGQVMEINQGSNVIDVTLDYIAGTPMLHVPCSNIPSSKDSMGMINIAVLNPLVATTGAPDQIQINVFIAGSDSFNLTTLSASKNLFPHVPHANTPLKKKKKVYVTHESDSDDIEVVEIMSNKRKPLIRGQSSVQPVIAPQSEVDTIQEDNLISKTENVSPRKPTAQVYVPGVRELLKKYQMCDSIILGTKILDENYGERIQSGVRRIKISDLFGRSANASILPVLNTMPLGVFTHVQGLYRLYKGGMNFKLVSRAIGNAFSPTNFSVFYQPPVYDTYPTPSTNNFTQTIENQVYRYLGDNAGGTPYLNSRTEIQSPYTTRLPVHFVNGVNKTAEFTIPYSSRFLSVISHMGNNSESELLINELVDLGDIYIVYNIPNYIPDTKTNTIFDVFFSISDDARFGTLFNVPQLSCYSYIKEDGTYSSEAFPDNYIATNPVSNTLVIL